MFIRCWNWIPNKSARFRPGEMLWDYRSHSCLSCSRLPKQTLRQVNGALWPNYTFFHLYFTNLWYLFNKQLQFQQYIFFSTISICILTNFVNISTISKWFQQQSMIYPIGFNNLLQKFNNVIKDWQSVYYIQPKIQYGHLQCTLAVATI